MKRFISSIIFTLIVIVVYQIFDINLFTIDFPRRVNADLFKELRNQPAVDTSIVILDITDIHIDSMQYYIEILESYEPKSIGVYVCNMNAKHKAWYAYFRQRKDIVTCDCDSTSSNGTSIVKTSKNVVTHFKSDRDSYFEIQLSNNGNAIKARGNERERINYRDKNSYLYSYLDFIYPDIIKNKIVLIGAFQDDNLITPMNEDFGQSKISYSDMSDVFVSANIISTIRNNEFTNEIDFLYQVLIMMIVSVLCSVLTRIVWTKYGVLNFILTLVILIVLNSLCSFMIVVLFSKGYYIQLNEMSMVLIVSAIVSIYWNSKDGKGSLIVSNSLSEK